MVFKKAVVSKSADAVDDVDSNTLNVLLWKDADDNAEERKIISNITWKTSPSSSALSIHCKIIYTLSVTLLIMNGY